MIDDQTLAQVVKRIIATSKPSRIILFGSYACGTADCGSDLDILVVKTEVPNKYTEAVRLHEAVGNLGVGVDVLVYSEAEYDRRSQVPGTLPYWADKTGRDLYEAAH